MLLELDAEPSLDPGRSGAKAAWLAMGRRAGLPILPGLVVEAAASRHHMDLGAAALQTRGSGGARLAVTAEPFAFSDELLQRAWALSPKLVARSSTTLEASPTWSGAFSSYVDLSPDDLAKAVPGCWASAFSVDSLERQHAAGIAPGSVSMAVLIQPALEPTAGGTATLDHNGVITVHGVLGSPAPLLQGWVSGETATLAGTWVGDGLVDRLGTATLNRIAELLNDAATHTGANQCEWAQTDRVYILQLGIVETRAPQRGEVREDAVLESEQVSRLVTALARAPGALGAQLVVPWAVAGLPPSEESSAKEPKQALNDAIRLADTLLTQVWGRDAVSARDQAQAALKAARMGNVEKLAPERTPDPDTAMALLADLVSVRRAIAAMGFVRNEDSAWFLTREEAAAALDGEPPAVPARRGLGKWEPLIAGHIRACGQSQIGTPGSPGLGAGRLRSIADTDQAEQFVPRSVFSSPNPVPGLAPLLWDASGVITESGSPAAHFFDSARSLGVPAVCGVRGLDDNETLATVDGHAGVVHSLKMPTDV